MNNRNKQPTNPGAMRTGGDAPFTVGDLRNAIHDLDNDVEIIFGATMVGAELSFYRFKQRGDNLLQMELNEFFPEPGKYSITVGEEMCRKK